MIPSSARVAARYLQAAKSPIDTATVEKLRKDFLVLMRNVDRVTTIEDLSTLVQGAHTWATHLENTMEGIIRGMIFTFRWAINGEPKYSQYTDDEVREKAKYWEARLRPGVWPLVGEMRSIPFESKRGWLDKWGGRRKEDLWGSDVLYEWDKSKKKWADRTKRIARKAWDTLDTYLGTISSISGGSTPAVQDEYETYRQEMEGFSVTFVGMNRGIDYLDAGVEKFKDGLAHYRERAAKVFPLLLGSAKLPIEVRGDQDIDCGGVYKGNAIQVCPVLEPPKRYAHIIAHEMGHHIYRSYLSEAAETFWYHAITQDYVDADLNDILAEWHEGEWAISAVPRLALTNPVVALQIDGLAATHSHNWDKREDAVRYMEEHGPKVRVPLHPITGYATKNPEEAFCEAVGRLVAYGPRAVDPVVLGWLQTILPRDIRVAHRVDSQ
jgi:hypothetical protein